MLLLLAVLLLMAAAGSLVGALLIGELDLAWASVGGSALAALALLVRRRRSRRRQQEAAKRGAPRPTASDQPGNDADSEHAGRDSSGDDDIEPAEEDTDAADLLVVWELADEVLVVDEHPRYHLESCRWPVAEQTERLAVSEARELGFTPCGRCRPDATLARQQRAGSVSQDAQ